MIQNNSEKYLNTFVKFYNKNMLLEKMIIENFGVFSNKTEIKLRGRFATIIGENGTGKSSLLFLINLLFDRKIRMKGISPEWIYDEQKETKITYIFDTSKFNMVNVFLPIEENKKISFNVEFTLEKDENIYYPIFYIGRLEKIKYYHAQKMPFEDYIEIINISSKFENYNEKWINKKFEEPSVLKKVQKEIKDSNKKISEISEINTFDRYAKDEIKKIFTDEKFSVQLSSNVKTTKIGRALNFFSIKLGKIVETHGDGFEKIFSIVSNINIYKTSGKMKIILIDELENNLFYIYQSQILDFIYEMLEDSVVQIISTTHSPNIVKIAPESSITKLRNGLEPSHFFLSEETNFEFYQKELSVAIFYENILLVEGHSEKLFYEYLLKKNDDFKKVINTKNIFIMNMQGYNFETSIKLLKNLTTNLVILTDNDIWKVQGKKTFTGLKRLCKIMTFFNPNYKNDYNFETINETQNLELYKKIIKDAEFYKIFTQNNFGDTFEDALFSEGFITEMEKKKLTNHKLKFWPEIITKVSKKITLEKITNSNYIFKWIKSIENYNE